MAKDVTHSHGREGGVVGVVRGRVLGFQVWLGRSDIDTSFGVTATVPIPLEAMKRAVMRGLTAFAGYHSFRNKAALETASVTRNLVAAAAAAAGFRVAVDHTIFLY
jgi:hypothetical protein